MNQAPYPYTRTGNRYTFISKGKIEIVKVVDITPISKNLYYLSFGDLGVNEEIDDKAISNNGDIVRVLTTVINIVGDFLTLHPDSRVGFSGSTPIRTMVYHRILRMYYWRFTEKFKIAAMVLGRSGFVEVEFDPTSTRRHYSFIIQKKN